jgi:hypothetical protein
MTVVLYTLDGIVVKIVSLKKSVQKIVCYFVVDTWCCPMPQIFLIIQSIKYKFLTQRTI